MVERRGTVYISPVTVYLPNGRMVDPEASAFSVSWQDWDEKAQRGQLIEDADKVVDAEAAIAWGRTRSDAILVRLGHTDETHFSAGHTDLPDRTDGRGRAYPLWPPDGPPPEGWWTPSDEAAARAEEFKRASGQA